jgi:hypothetical protein
VVTTDYYCLYVFIVSGSSVGIATHYGLEDTGSYSGEGRERNFSHPSRPALESTQLPVCYVPCIFSGGKAAGAWR